MDRDGDPCGVLVGHVMWDQVRLYIEVLERGEVGQLVDLWSFLGGSGGLCESIYDPRTCAALGVDGYLAHPSDPDGP